MEPVRTDTLRRATRVALGVVLASAALAAPTASAAPGSTSSDTTQANVIVGSAISLTGLTDDFTLQGLPGATVTGPGAVTFTVQTNNFAGYVVTVQARTATLNPTKPGNTDTIPIGNLSVRESGSTAYLPLSNTAPVTVHTQPTKSADAGDPLSNDYQVVIPFVNEDRYTATLDYVATTL
ncbi:hypothetical protein [Actinosynnema sp. NPDC020468]|uniref:hypothetical protein n=1 Tax=Actinosynnema sp. NPDC020468 TaxID=3154488 RepID=UPI0033D57930